ESDAALVEFEQTAIAEGHAKDVRSEILEGGMAGADGLGMDHPRLAPSGAGDLGEQAGGLFQLLMKPGAEDQGEGLDGHEEIFTRWQPALVRSPASAGDDEVDMWVIEQRASPGVEHAPQADETAAETWVLGQL